TLLPSIPSFRSVFRFGDACHCRLHSGSVRWCRDISFRFSGPKIPHESSVLDIYAIAGPLAEPIGVRRMHSKECHRRDLYMRIDGDEPVDSVFFDDPDFTLICRTDLLGSEPFINTAAYLGRLYREQGDRFVGGLRGAFAIVLYDHNQRT